MIKRQRSDIPCFQLMFRNKPLHSPHATLEDYQITRDQMIKCIPLHRTGPNEADKTKHEKRMQQADLLIQELKGRVTSLNKSLDEMKTKIDSTKSMSALQEIRSVMELRMKGEVFEARKPDDVDSFKSNLVSLIMEEVRKKKTEIDNAYHDLLQNTQHDETLEDHIQKRIEHFEEMRVEWTTDDVQCWMHLIEDEYFDDDEYESFLEQLVEMGIDGEKLPELNSKILLGMMGLDDEDQSVLLRNLCRVCENWTGSKRRDLCGLCMENRINSVMIPCGHQYSCYDCLVNNEIDKCPICRKQITQKMRTYMNGF